MCQRQDYNAYSNKFYLTDTSLTIVPTVYNARIRNKIWETNKCFNFNLFRRRYSAKMLSKMCKYELFFYTVYYFIGTLLGVIVHF